MSPAGTEPPTDPPEAPTTTDPDGSEVVRGAEWDPDSSEAWSGADDPHQEWRPEDPSAWEGAKGTRTIPRRIRRSRYHRRMVRRSRRRASNAPLDLAVRSPRRRRSKYRRRSVRRTVLKLVLLAAGIVFLGAIAALADAYYHSYRIYEDVRGIPRQLTAVRQQLAKGELPPDDRFAEMSQVVDAATHTAESRLSMKVARIIPFFNRPIVAVDRGLDAAHGETQAAVAMRDIVADALGTVATGQTPFAPASSTPIFRDGNVNVDLIERLTPRLEQVARYLQEADQAIRAIPSVPFVHQLDSAKADALRESSQALALIQDALSGARLLPAFMGADRPKTYLLAMQNNADQRATGGAVLAYAFVTIDKGRLDFDGGGSIYDIDQRFGFSDVELPPEIQWYHDHVSKSSPRLNNLNYSPDFPVVAKAWSTVIEKALGKKIDGAIAIDPIAVSYILGKRKIEVPSYDKPITDKNIVRVVENDQYRLSFDQQQLFPAQLIGEAWKILKDPTPFVRSMKQLTLGIREKHIQLWSVEPDQQALLEELGWDGRLRVGEGDFLYVTDNKRVPNKVDYYTYISIDYRIDIDADGIGHATAQVTLENETPPAETKFIIGPNGGLNKALIGLFVPDGAVLESADPEAGPRDHTESGAQVFLRTAHVEPGEPQVVQFTYTVPKVVLAVPGGKLYRLTVQHQPFVNVVELRVTVTLPRGTVTRSAPGWKVDGNVATFQTQLTHDTVREISF